MDHGGWKSERITDQGGKIIIVTGANSGLGLEASTVLSAKGAKIIMAVRDLEKGKAAVSEIIHKHKKANVELMQLDLSDFNSIHKFSEEFHAKYSNLHILINNAGIMYPKYREITKQGFETHFGTNHLGHFLLTGLMLDLLKNTPQSRVVTQSSALHKYGGDIHFDDLNGEKTYDKSKAYAQSKLANLLFTYELDRRFKIHRQDSMATAAHPGYTATGLQRSQGLLVALANKFIAQNIEIGALPVLRAATEGDLVGSEYFGPTKWLETRGYPEKVTSSDKSYDAQLAKKLWEVSEKLVGFTYKFN
ncbi:NAD(P)-dependent dehydrogenase (short-subunit alcohol dehydrogenase family) [Paenibacillus phyllosphaerae]|uniref:NAD(P)-dependent dehydrogenase (Short-subunit alcohol dehydrogenase family) n=1 Tax=Paenibacillus phyllosphaerae TaxID=274593 RepID=A0A7W5B3G6_9BACL|nr:oxidoreductase [Paenibacillus phyllosphaerae]MBB3113722.1 NAD(P)-dependent dehydrogenase (short-subunit alcohol dehydrogenase family) [Paenibacillus phyllosphaerae]